MLWPQRGGVALGDGRVSVADLVRTLNGLAANETVATLPLWRANIVPNVQTEVDGSLVSSPTLGTPWTLTGDDIAALKEVVLLRLTIAAPR